MRACKRVLLITGGLYHDVDFARLELLRHLARQEHMRVDVRADYPGSFDPYDGLVTYTCCVLPDDAQITALAAWLARGGRWFALHGTNSTLHIQPDGKVLTPELPPALFDLLGSQFLAHPAPGRFRVNPDAPHPLTEGIDPFWVEDEHYLQRHAPGNQVLLWSEFEGETSLFETSRWARCRQQTLYLRPHARGGVLYLTLGHARGRYDMMPLMAHYPHVERGAWILPVFDRLLARGIAWMDRKLPLGVT